jgi:hypothetical protein
MLELEVAATQRGEMIELRCRQLRNSTDVQKLTWSAKRHAEEETICRRKAETLDAEGLGGGG